LILSKGRAKPDKIMKDKPEKKPKGRPLSTEASLKTTPNITVANRLQWEARALATKMGMGFSEWVARAIERQLVRDGETQIPPTPAPPESKRPPYAQNRKCSRTGTGNRERVQHKTPARNER
jgi:hypothetical protein